MRAVGCPRAQIRQERNLCSFWLQKYAKDPQAPRNCCKAQFPATPTQAASCILLVYLWGMKQAHCPNTSSTCELAPARALSSLPLYLGAKTTVSKSVYSLRTLEGCRSGTRLQEDAGWDPSSYTAVTGQRTFIIARGCHKVHIAQCAAGGKPTIRGNTHFPWFLCSIRVSDPSQ